MAAFALRFALATASVLAVTLGLACEAAPEPLRTQDLLQGLMDTRDFARLEDQHSQLASTWDRTGANFDGFDFPGEAGEVNVLLEVVGPGAVHRVSTGLLGEFVAGTRIQFFFDGEAQPSIDLLVDDFFDPREGPFGPQLAHHGVYPTVRMPMPFAESLRVQLYSAARADAPGAEPPVDAHWGLYWQIAYTTYTPDRAVESYSHPPSPEVRRSMSRVADRWADSLAGGRAFAPALRTDDDIFLAAPLAPGHSMRAVDRDCATVRDLEIHVAPNWPAVWRGLRLRAYWDGAREAAIDLPLAHLMGAGEYGDDPAAAFDSLAMGGGRLGANWGQAYLRLPMPYREGMELSIVNEGPFEAEVELLARPQRCVDEPLATGPVVDESDAPRGYLHTQVHSRRAAESDAPTAGPMAIPVHEVFHDVGRGKLVGVILRVDWPFEDLWWGEGDWLISRDDDPPWPPSYHGTGTEEFFDGGWTLFERRPWSGVIKARPGLVTNYAFFPNDAFSYTQRLDVHVETLGLLIADDVIQEAKPMWSSTAFYYSASP